MLVTVLSSSHKSEPNPHKTLCGGYDYYPISHVRGGKRPERWCRSRGGCEPGHLASVLTHSTTGSVASGWPRLRTSCLGWILSPCYPKCGLCTRSIGTPWELGRRAGSETHWIRICILTASPGHALHTQYTVWSDTKKSWPASTVLHWKSALLGDEKETDCNCLKDRDDQVRLNQHIVKSETPNIRDSSVQSSPSCSTR